MGRSYTELLTTVSSKDIARYQAFSRVEPFGFDVDNLMMASQTAAIVNISSHRRAFKAKDFLLNTKPPSNQSLKQFMDNLCQ